jgi:aldose 1-epimerase
MAHAIENQAAAPRPAAVGAATLTTTAFGRTADGKSVTLVTMTSGRGVIVKFMSYGGTIIEIVTPDRNAHPANIVLGFATLKEYEVKGGAGGIYFGALIGRYANRIAKGRFTLDGREFKLAINNPPNALHGGERGFDKQVWQIEPLVTSGAAVSARLSFVSPDGDQGYPGALRVNATYTLSAEGVFTIRYDAVTDRPTVVNLTNHNYFNLAGAGSQNGVFAQLLTINADAYTPTDANAIPLGESAKVEGTPFDFRKPTVIGARLRVADPQLIQARGYDHNWVLNKTGDAAQPQLAARALDPVSGRTLECLTTEPGVQMYTANFLNGAYAGNGGLYRQTDGFALETQHFPDSPNHPNFPTTELRPSERFASATALRFGVAE